MTHLINGPVSTDFLRQLADDLREDGREATADDFADCASTIDGLRTIVRAVLRDHGEIPVDVRYGSLMLMGDA